MPKKRKKIRSDNTYLISRDSTDNPKLEAKVLKDGRHSLYLDFYYGYRPGSGSPDIRYRKRESLGLYLYDPPRTPSEKRQNAETLELAKRIRFERGDRSF